MLFYIKNRFLRKIKLTSVRLGQSNADYRRTLLFIQIIIVASVGLLIACIFDFILIDNTLFYIDVSLLLGFASTLLLIYKGHIRSAQILILLFSNLLFLINGLHEGPNAGNQFLFFPYLCALFILFPENNRGLLIIGCIAGVVNFSVLEYFNYHLWNNLAFSEEHARYNYILCFVLGVTIMVVMLYYLISINKIHEARLYTVNLKLKTQNKTLKKTNAELDSFVYKTSHDLRSPLTSIMGLLTLLKKEKDSEEANKYVHLIEKSVIKLDTYIIDVLSISRNARSEVTFKKIDIQKILNDAFDEYSFVEKYALIEKKITVHQKCEFYSDQMRISMIINNLISNAFRYHNHTKEHQYVHVYVNIDESHMNLTISDNGIGIDQKHLEHIFNMFYRATNINNGSGLGLYIVKEALEKLNATVSVKSVIREDTQITVHIPNHFNTSMKNT